MKVISFYSDKGGAGKTFLAMWIAGILRSKFNKRVLIVDTIAGYENLSSKRKEDLCRLDNLGISEDDYVEIYQINQFEEFLNFCKEKEYEYDYILADVGAINEVNMYILMKCNYIFVVTDQNFEKRAKIYSSFKNMIGRYEGFNIEDVKFVFNKVSEEISEKELKDKISKFRDSGDDNIDIDVDSFIFSPIYMNKKRFGRLNTLSAGVGNVPADLMVLAENILKLTN